MCIEFKADTTYSFLDVESNVKCGQTDGQTDRWTSSIHTLELLMLYLQKKSVLYKDM